LGLEKGGYMTRSRFYGISGGVAFALLVVLAQASPVVAGPTTSPTPVKVVNSATEPVPTLAQGTTNVAGTVQIGGDVSVKSAETAVLLFDQSQSINAAPWAALWGPINVSAYRQIRVSVGSFAGSCSIQSVSVLSVLGDNTSFPIGALSPALGNTCFYTGVFDVPGSSIIVDIDTLANYPTTARVIVWGR
jgi:hypothetical protein